jgi:hypothetical protein
MRRRAFAFLAVALMGCRLGSLVSSPDNGAGRLQFAVQPNATTTGSFISPPVRVVVLNEMGKPDSSFRERMSVELGANPTGATLTGTTAIDVVNGVAVFSNLRIDKPGAGYVLRAATPSKPAVASARFNVTMPPADRLSFVVQPTATPVGETISPSVKIVARDDDGEIAEGYTGTITVSLGVNPAGATLSGTLSVNAVEGVATFDDLRIDRSSSGYKLSATASNVSPATSAAFTITSPASKLTFIVQPSNTREGQKLKTFKVAARDNDNKTVTSYGGPITIQLSPGSPNGALSGTLTVNAQGGIATFDDVKIDNARGNNFRFVATAPGLFPALSNAFKVDDNDDDLVFAVQPSLARANVPITPAVQIVVLDSFGDVVTDYTGAVTVDLAPNQLGGRLSGTLTVTVVNGVATFPDLTVDLIGLDYHLTAGFAGQPLTVQSQSFAVMP